MLKQRGMVTVTGAHLRNSFSVSYPKSMKYDEVLSTNFYLKTVQVK